MEEPFPETWAELLPLMSGEIKLVVEEGDITLMTFENSLVESELVESDLSVAEELGAVAIHLIHLFLARLSTLQLATRQLASQPSCSGILEARQDVPQVFIDAFADEEQPD